MSQEKEKVEGGGTEVRRGGSRRRSTYPGRKPMRVGESGRRRGRNRKEGEKVGLEDLKRRVPFDLSLN